MSRKAFLVIVAFVLVGSLPLHSAHAQTPALLTISFNNLRQICEAKELKHEREFIACVIQGWNTSLKTHATQFAKAQLEQFSFSEQAFTENEVFAIVGKSTFYDARLVCNGKKDYSACMEGEWNRIFLQLFTQLFQRRLLDLQREEVKRNLESVTQKPLEMPSGYPYCSDVLQRHEMTTSDLLGALSKGNPSVAERLDELQPLAKILLDPAPNQLPKVVTLNPEGYSSSFLRDTPVIRLDPIKGKTEVKIGTILPGDFILSSTVHLISYPADQADCWARVVNTNRSYLPNDGEVLHISYGSSERKSFALDVTPEHRFYGSLDDGSSWGWMVAKDLKVGVRLKPNCSSDGCWVSGRDSSKPMAPLTRQHAKMVLNFKKEKSWVDNVSSLLNGTNEPRDVLFDLYLEYTHAYYVGPEENRVLVHNCENSK